MNTVIKVGMADLNIAIAPYSIRTSGLGSCVGLCIYDPFKKVAGMAHVMLPTSELARQQEFNYAKYADTAIPTLIELMQKNGANLRHFQAKMAGGAQMFAFKNPTDAMRIGLRNVQACKEQLQKYHIPLLAEDTGGSFGRTIEMFADNGILQIRTVNQGTKDV